MNGATEDCEEANQEEKFRHPNNETAASFANGVEEGRHHTTISQ